MFSFYRAKLFITHWATLDFSVEFVRFFVDAEIYGHPPHHIKGGKLNKFEIRSLGNINVGITGGLIGWLFNRGFVQLLKNFIMDLMEKKIAKEAECLIKDLIQTALGNFYSITFADLFGCIRIVV